MNEWRRKTKFIPFLSLLLLLLLQVFKTADGGGGHRRLRSAGRRRHRHSNVFGDRNILPLCKNQIVASCDCSGKRADRSNRHLSFVQRQSF
jgi:hypothetical protein